MIQIESKYGNNYGNIYGEIKTSIPKIKVIGIGGGGNNAVRQMVEDKVKDVEFYFINTELAMLNKTKMENILQIGKETTKGLGAGANPDRLEITVANADTVNGISSDRIALLQSPVFIGNPTAPTPDGTDIYSITNVNFVVNKIKELEELIMAKIEEYHPGATNDDGTVDGGQ